MLELLDRLDLGTLSLVCLSFLLGVKILTIEHRKSHQLRFSYAFMDCHKRIGGKKSYLLLLVV